MKLPRRKFEIIQEHAIRDLPYECCGLLVGRKVVDHRGNIDNIVHEIAPCRNTLFYGRENGFEISYSEYLEVEREARSLGLDIIGSYHSHINSTAVPSKSDVDFASAGHSMLIIALQGGIPREVTSWLRRDAGGFHQEQIKVLA